MAYALALKLAILPKEKKLVLDKKARMDALEGFTA